MSSPALRGLSTTPLGGVLDGDGKAPQQGLELWAQRLFLRRRPLALRGRGRGEGAGAREPQRLPVGGSGRHVGCPVNGIFNADLRIWPKEADFQVRRETLEDSNH